MKTALSPLAGALALAAFALAAAPAAAQTTSPAGPCKTAPSAAHDHDHGSDAIYKGYFDDEQVKTRPLTDWQGDWQSVHTHLANGTLDPVMDHKAKKGDKSADAYRAYYETGYRTDVDRILIKGDSVTFHRGTKPAIARYASDGHEILTYDKGNRGVRYIFKKLSGDDTAPAFIQFSDHRIAPEPSDHFHLYQGNDRAGLLNERTNWPTYYPAALDAAEIARQMMAH